MPFGKNINNKKKCFVGASQVGECGVLLMLPPGFKTSRLPSDMIAPYGPHGPLVLVLAFMDGARCKS